MTGGSLPVLANPPIVEAVVDIDCDFTQPLDLASIGVAAAEAVGPTYPVSDQVWKTNFRLDISPASSKVGPLDTQPVCHALRYWNTTKDQLVQFRRAGFSFNKLKPYTSLDDYMPEIRENWLAFTRIAMPSQVSVVRLRYINAIDVNVEPHDIDDYFRIGPRIPDLHPELVVARFTNRCAVHDATRSADGELLLDLGAAGDVSRYNLTITVGRAVQFSPDDWPSIEGVIGILRSFKNILFKESLTEKCLELLK